MASFAKRRKKRWSRFCCPICDSPPRTRMPSAILPFLLATVVDDKLSSYLRGQAMDAAARLGAGEAKVVEAFIQALDNPNPKDSSGVHDRAIQLLGEMGKAAWPAKPAIT